MTLFESLPHIVQRAHQARTQDDIGGDVKTYVNFGEPIECWIQNVSAREITEFAKRDQAVTHKVYFAEEPGLGPGDRVIVLAIARNGFYQGRELNFMAGDDATAGMGLGIKIFFDQERN